MSTTTTASIASTATATERAAALDKVATQKKEAKLNSTAATFKAEMSTFSDMRSERADEIRSTLNEESSKRDRLQVKTQETHALANARLAGMSAAATNLVYKYKLDASALEKGSRELKLHTCAILEAIAHNNGTLCKRPYEAFGAFLAAKGLSNVKTSDFQREAGHTGHTQASYSRTILKFLGAIESAEKSGSVWIYKFNADSKLLSDFVALFK
jgi:hypothetical protein